MATTLSRPTIADDSGTPDTPVGDGTLIDSGFWSDLFDRIDALFTATTHTLGGLLRVDGLGVHLFPAAGTGANTIRITNTTTGTANRASVELGTDTDADAGRLEVYTSTYTETGAIKQDGLALRSLQDGGLSVSAEHASGDVRLYARGTAKLATFNGDRLSFSGGTPGAHVPIGILGSSINTSTTATTGDPEEDLHSFTLPANTLDTDGQAVRYIVAVTTASNANAKQLIVYFGSTAVLTTAGTGYNNDNVQIDVLIVRTGASSQKCVGNYTHSAGDRRTVYATASEDLTTALAIKVAGDGVAASDISVEFSMVELVG